MLLLAPPSPTPSPSPDVYTSIDVTKICNTDVVCSRVYEWTDNQWLANSSYWVIVKPLRILGIILAALLIRWLLLPASRRGWCCWSVA